MTKYRLKPEAVKFFKDKYATKILSYNEWESIGVDVIALEEVQDCYLVFGHESKRETYSSSSLSGWDEKGSKFHFTIHFPSTKHKEHDEFSKGKPVRELMNRIQRNIDNFYSDFINE